MKQLGESGERALCIRDAGKCPGQKHHGLAKNLEKAKRGEYDGYIKPWYHFGIGDE